MVDFITFSRLADYNYGLPPSEVSLGDLNVGGSFWYEEPLPDWVETEIFGVVGTDGADYLEGEEAVEFVSGGIDVINAGDGDDTIWGEGVAFEDENDVTGDGEQSLNLNTDIIGGGDGNDTIYGQAGSDVLHGENGNDLIYGGSGNDSLYGHYEIQSGDLGYDSEEFLEEGVSEIVVVIGAPLAVNELGIEIDAFAYFHSIDDSLDDIDWLFGGDGNDNLHGSYGEDILYGGADADNIQGGLGEDLIYGGEGQDLIYGGRGDDTVYGGNYFEEYTTAQGDTIFGDMGNDELYGSSGNDFFYGGDDDDVISGYGGDDIIAGDTGDDTLDGGDGDDTLYGGNEATGGSGLLTFTDDPDWDEERNGDDVLSGGLGEDELYGGYGADVLDGGEGNDSVYGGSGEDLIYGAAGQDILYGGDASDFLKGDLGNDTIYGGNGDDENLSGNEGDDILYGDDGADAMYGGVGEDILYGGNASDFIRGDLGNDTIHGGNGDDENLSGNEGDDILYGGAGADAMYGGIGEDILTGGGGNDALTGGDGADTIYGGDGADEINGGDGNNTLYGGGGDDRFIASQNDEIYGGAGNDVLEVARGLGHFELTYDEGSTSSGVIDFLSGTQISFDSIEEFLYTFPDVIGLPSSVTVTEDESSAVDLSGLTLTDQDTTGEITITLIVSEGTLTALNGGGVTATGSDTSEVTLVGTLDALNTYLNFDDLVVQYTGAPNAAGVATATLTITGDDGLGAVTLGTVDIDITPVNDAPVLATALQDQSSAEDTAVSFTLPDGAFTDIDTVDLSLSATLAGGDDLPDWLVFDPDTQTFSGTPPQDFNGTIEIDVIASDGDAFATDTFDLVITPVDDPMTLSTTNDGGTLIGGDKDDTLLGGFGDDIIDGNDGADVIRDEGGDDVVTGGGGNDSIQLMSGSNIASGGEGNDLVVGGYNNDTLSGNEGSDAIIGDVSTFFGGSDRIIGGFGDDFLEGRGGADTFVFTINDGNDTIGTLSIDTSDTFGVTVTGADFVSGVDMIELVGFDLTDGTEALSQVTDVDGVATFSAEGTTITFAELTLSDLSAYDFQII